MSTDPGPNLEAARATYQKITDNIAKIMRGQSMASRQMLAALASGGHVLLEGFHFPEHGQGRPLCAKEKRWLKRSPPDSSGCNSRPTAAAIGYSPGVSIFDQRDQQFHFHEGPVFTNILLADEINRASPRTQSRPVGGDGRKPGGSVEEFERAGFYRNCFL